MFSTQVVEEIKTHISRKIILKKIVLFKIMSRNMETEGPQMTSQYGAYDLHAG